MITEEMVRNLAKRIWEAEGCPDGKHLDHYYRAKRMLEERESVSIRMGRLLPRSASYRVGSKSN